MVDNNSPTSVVVDYDENQKDSIVKIHYLPVNGNDSSITYLLFKKITDEGKVVYKLDYPRFLFENNKLEINKKLADSLVNQAGYTCFIEEHFFVLKNQMSKEDFWNNYLKSIDTNNVVVEINW